MSWSTHVNNVISRVRHRLATIIRYGSLPPTIFCVLYSAFVLPVFDYCDVVWCPTTAKLTSMTERVHSKFVKRLAVSYRPKFSFTLMERRRFHTAIQIFRSIHQKSPSYLATSVTFFKGYKSGHIGRNVNRLFVPRVLTNYGKRSFFYRGTVLWNSLSRTVTDAATLSSFKNLYNNFR